MQVGKHLRLLLEECQIKLRKIQLLHGQQKSIQCTRLVASLAAYDSGIVFCMDTVHDIVLA